MSSSSVVRGAPRRVRAFDVASTRLMERRIARRPASAFASASASSSSSSVETDDVERKPTSSSVTLSSRRRALCAVAVGATMRAFTSANPVSVVARADEDDDEQAEVEANMKRVMERNSGEQTFIRQVGLSTTSEDGVRPCAFEVSNLWTVGESATRGLTTTWGEIVDPVNGQAAASAVTIATPNFNARSIADLGKPEDVPVARALGLDGDDSYRRADMLGAAKRVDAKTGQVYYDWELVASPPPQACPSAVGCLYPEHIYLVSASVLDGVLYVLSLDATPAQWRVTGNSVKRIRNSFAVGVREDVFSDAVADVDAA